MNYIELNIAIDPKAPWTEILIAQLAEIDFESFTENNDQLQAYITEELMNSKKVDDVITSIRNNDVSVDFTTKKIEEENWNATWEADFLPVTVEDKLIIRAPFHKEENGYKEEVIIQPQMSFGTGHHQTTWLLSSLLCDKDFRGLTVLDSGTGTGVLAILALKKGAKKVIGTDIEKGAVENAIENFGRNHLSEADIRLGDIDCVTERNFDVIIANINKNVLKVHLPHYSERTATSGELYLSGFFVSDTEELISAAQKVGYHHDATYAKEEWAVLKFTKD